jgi:polar amino acid transport system substrate-binding protein
LRHFSGRLKQDSIAQLLHSCLGAFRLGCLSACLLVAMPGHALVLTTEDYPPFNMADPQTGRLTGISVEKVIELMRRAKEPYTMAPYPWTRAYQMAVQMDDTCVFSTTRTPEREALFHWVGPLVTNDWIVFRRSDDPRKPKTLEELRPFVIGGYNNDAVSDFLKAEGFKVDLANTDGDNPAKLLHQRFDFWATGELIGYYVINRSKFNGKIKPLFKFKTAELYLACRLTMGKQRIERFNSILREMERDGTNAVIERKYRH